MRKRQSQGARDGSGPSVSSEPTGCAGARGTKKTLLLKQTLKKELTQSLVVGNDVKMNQQLAACSKKFIASLHREGDRAVGVRLKIYICPF